MSNRDSQTYVYEPLPLGSFIRVFTLVPGQHSAPIRVNLQHLELPGFEEYAALSYVWGDSNDKVSVLCNGKRLAIPSNLDAALRVIRARESVPSFLWADSICINQTNVLEKNHQVALMRHIYKQATEVFAWLGPDTENIASSAFRLAKQIASRDYQWPWKRDHAASQVQRGLAENTSSRALLQKGFSPHVVRTMSTSDLESWISLDGIICRKWFDRVWVIQEVGLAEKAGILCGTESISWQEFGGAMNLITEDVRVVAPRFAHCALMYRFFATGPSSFLDSLSMSKNYEATDPRDRVYAMLGHPSARANNGALIIEPDYSISVQVLNRRTTIAILEQSHTLEPISRINHPDDICFGGRDSPSWVPDWCGSRPFTSFWYYLKSRAPDGYEVCPKYKLSEDLEVLQVCGLHIGTVLWCGIYANSTQLNEVRNIADVTKVLPVDHPTSAAKLAADMLHVFWTNWNHIQNNDLHRLEENIAGLHHATEASVDPDDLELIPESQERVSRFLRHVLVDRKFLITNRGHIGLGPRAMRDGDMVCTIKSSISLFVLRPRASGSGYYFVGECHMHDPKTGPIFSWIQEDDCIEEQQAFDLY